MTTTYDTALDRITQAQDTEATRLDLSGLNLAELPDALWDLTALDRLYLGGNELVLRGLGSTGSHEGLATTLAHGLHFLSLGKLHDLLLESFVLLGPLLSHGLIGFIRHQDAHLRLLHDRFQRVSSCPLLHLPRLFRWWSPVLKRVLHLLKQQVLI